MLATAFHKPVAELQRNLTKGFEGIRDTESQNFATGLVKLLNDSIRKVSLRVVVWSEGRVKTPDWRISEMKCGRLSAKLSTKLRRAPRARGRFSSDRG